MKHKCIIPDDLFKSITQVLHAYVDMTYGYTIKRSNAWKVSFEEDTIYTHHRTSNVEYICSLLHEIGHLEEPYTIFKDIRKTPKRDSIVIIEQEHCAWAYGLQLLEGLTFPGLDDEVRHELILSYKRTWVKYLYEYIQEISKFNKEELYSLSEPLLDREADELGFFLPLLYYYSTLDGKP